MDEQEYVAGDQPEGPEQFTQPLRNVHLTAGEVEAVIAGHLFLEIQPRLLGTVTALTPGHIIDAGAATLLPAGSAAYTGLALHKLGVATSLVARVGDDTFGRALCRTIEEHDSSLTGTIVRAQAESSAYTISLRLAKGEHVVISAPGANKKFSSGDIRYAVLERAGLFHFGGSSQMEHIYLDEGTELVEIFLRAKACGVTTSLDLMVSEVSAKHNQIDWQSVLAAVLPYVDVFLPNVEEMLFALRRPLYDKLKSKAGNHHSLLDLVTPEVVSELGQTLLALGAKIVGLKVGQRGMYLCTAGMHALERLGRALPPKITMWAERELWVPCFVSEVVESTGADDATNAGFLLGLLRGMSPEATITAACAVRACSVEEASTLGGIKSWPEIMERIAGGWSRQIPARKARSPLDMTHFGWRWHETFELWIGPRDPVHLHR